MFKYKILSIFALTSLLALMTASCASKVEVYDYQPEARVDEAFIRQGADFSRYNAVLIDSISVWYPTENAPSEENAPVAAANLEKAEQLFKQVIQQSLEGGYQLADKAAADVLRIQVEFVDLRSIPNGGFIPLDIQAKKFKTAPGHITLVSELQDSKSGEVLARVADMGDEESKGGDGVVDWDAIEADFRVWGKMLRGWLDEVHTGTWPAKY